MQQEKSGKGIEWMVSAVYVAAMLLIYPNRTAVFAPDWIIFAFSAASITLLAGGILLTGYDRVRERIGSLPGYFKIAFSVFAAITLWHLIRHFSTYGADDAARSLSYLILPLFAFVFYRETKSVLPWILTVFWGIDVILSVPEYFTTGIPAGLAMNKNWNAVMLLASAPFVILLLSRKIPAKKIFLPLAAGVTVITLILTGMCHSLGAWTGLTIAAIAVFYFSRKNIPLRRKILGWSLAILLIGGAIGVYFASDKILAAAERNDRIFFYLHTPEMIADAPLFGHGIPSFEQDFLPYRTEEYFLKRHAADRIDHPHNHFLFMAAGTGLIGLAAWLVLLLVPLIRFALKDLREADRFDKVCFFSCIMLFVHAQFDLILFKEPTCLLALFLTGILWRFVTTRDELPDGYPGSRLSIRVCGICGGVLILGALLMAGLNLYASWNFRAGERQEMQGRHTEADKYYRKAMKAAFADNSAYYCYQTAERYCTRDRGDREFALAILDQISRSETPDFAHIHLLQGRLLLTNGNDRDAIPHLIREAELYPLEPAPMLALWEYFLRSGNEDGAKYAAGEANERLKKLKLDAFIEDPLQLKVRGEDGKRLNRPDFDPRYKVRY